MKRSPLFFALVASLAMLMTAHPAAAQVRDLCGGTGSGPVCIGAASGQPTEIWTDLQPRMRWLGVTFIPIGDNTITMGDATHRFANLYAVTFTGAIVGNADTATKLLTARTIAGVSFDGSANIAIPMSGLTGFGTGVATALAVNVGTAGAPVVNGGALGTPSSGTWAPASIAITRTTMSATLVLVASSNVLQGVDPNGSDRQVTLPTNATNLCFQIHHFGSANTVTIKDASAATVSTLSAGQTATVVYDGTAWEVF